VEDSWQEGNQKHLRTLDIPQKPYFGVGIEQNAGREQEEKGRLEVPVIQ
jgi:hypothetical protein